MCCCSLIAPHTADAVTGKRLKFLRNVAQGLPPLHG